MGDLPDISRFCIVVETEGLRKAAIPLD